MSGYLTHAVGRDRYGCLPQVTASAQHSVPLSCEMASYRVAKCLEAFAWNCVAMAGHDQAKSVKWMKLSLGIWPGRRTRVGCFCAVPDWATRVATCAEVVGKGHAARRQSQSGCISPSLVEKSFSYVGGSLDLSGPKAILRPEGPGVSFKWGLWPTTFERHLSDV